jgi:hypothetical protein
LSSSPPAASMCSPPEHASGDDAITCTDVLLAMQQCGGAALTHTALAHYVRMHIHGTHTPGGDPPS